MPLGSDTPNGAHQSHPVRICDGPRGTLVDWFLIRGAAEAKNIDTTSEVKTSILATRPAGSSDSPKTAPPESTEWPSVAAVAASWPFAAGRGVPSHGVSFVGPAL